VMIRLTSIEDPNGTARNAAEFKSNNDACTRSPRRGNQSGLSETTNRREPLFNVVSEWRGRLLLSEAEIHRNWMVEGRGDRCSYGELDERCGDTGLPGP
jgi:hypothetical protein